MYCKEVIARQLRRHKLGDMVEFFTIRYSIRLIWGYWNGNKRANRREKSPTNNIVHIRVKPDSSSLMPDILCISLSSNEMCVDVIDRVVYQDIVKEEFIIYLLHLGVR
jgi:hypothetical protein